MHLLYIIDFQSTVNTLNYSNDLNAQSISNVSARLDQFA